MNAKKLLNKKCIIWGASAVVITGVLIAANLVAQNFRTLLDNRFGGGKAIVSKEDTGIVFEKEFNSKDAAYKNGNKVTEQICEEGMILLKNDNNALPLKKNAKVSVFGTNSVNLVYGGSGSAAPDPNGERKTIFDSLTAAGFSYNKTLEEFYKKQPKRDSNPAMEHGDATITLGTGETSLDKYTAEVKASYDQYNDAALVVLSRIAGENWDLPKVAKDNSSRHYLELDNNERALIKDICDSGKFQHIVILLNGSNYIDCGFLEIETDPAFSNKIDACINIGSPGASGIMALGRILSGEVNPSGHTVDTVYTNYASDPTWQNFGGNFENGGNAYLNPAGKATGYFMVEYEENIYMGYRYYETRGHVDGESWYKQHVIYPFGYGLSYTTFTQTIKNKADLASALDAKTKFDVEIEVTNTGDVAGKQVVQLYAEAPYTNGGIEKSYKVLVGFAKTKLLEKGEKDTVTITVDPYSFASYDSRDMNSNGFKGYELEKGDYIFHAGTDAHNDFDTFTKNLAADARFDKDPVTGYEVKNLFDDVTGYMKTSLSRSNFDGTFPTPVTKEERKVTTEINNALKSYETTNDEVYTEMPKTNQEITVELKELAGKAYDDPLWDKFLDQLSVSDYLALFNDGCYKTTKIEKNGVTIVPKTVSADGPTGIVNFMGNPEVYGCCYYCSECLVAQTYNLDMAKLEANAIGNECLIGNEKGDGVAYPGWYAPGVNLHRSPFSGRNTEYYSEDPFVNGKFAATVIKGVKEKGVYANVKHFAVNDQETHRSDNGIATWLDEQALRELYLKAFEIAVKEGDAMGLMTSFNRVGTEWAGGSYRLVTTILRKEWGFVGSVICDFHTGAYMDSKQMLMAGGDLNLCGDQSLMLNSIDNNNAKEVTLVRQAAHRVLYSIANSNVMSANILGYEKAMWEILLMIGTIVVAVGTAAWGAAVIVTSLLKKEEEPAKAE